MAKKPLRGVRFTTAATVMKKNIVTIDGKETVADAIKIMREKKVSSLLVNRRGQEDAWGIVTRERRREQNRRPREKPERGQGLRDHDKTTADGITRIGLEILCATLS